MMILILFRKKLSVIYFLIFAISFAVFSQDVEKSFADIKAIKDAQPVKVTGGYNASSVFYGVNGIPSRRAPFAYAMNANLNFNLFGKITIPLAINYTNNGISGENPFSALLSGLLNRTGISPKYKSVTLHLGDRSMDFTRYSYSGVRFYGVGIELAPEKSIFKFSAFYGRLSRRTLADTINGVAITPSYLRMAWGTKIDIGKKKHVVSLIAFRAKDDYFSGDPLSTRYGLSPQENIVFGIKTKNQITKKLDAQFEFNTSAYTSDYRNLKFEQVGSFNYFNNLGGLFSPVLSTRFNNAYSIAANYKEKFFTVGATFLHVDPTYQSLGVLTAKNDIEAYTLNATTSLFKNKINLAATGGLEFNNLSENLKQTMKRYIGSMNVTYNIIKDLSLNINYSNFNHSTGPSIITKVDSVKLVQVNQSMGGMLNYSFGKTELKHSTMISATFQEARDIKEYVNYEILALNKVRNYLASYTLNKTDWQAMATFTLNYNHIQAPSINTISIGPSLNLNKKILNKKLTLNYTYTFLSNQDIGAASTTMNNKLTGNFKVNKHHTLKVETSVIGRRTIEGKGQSFTEFQGKIGYDYVF